MLRRISRSGILAGGCLIFSGCASTQLNYNALDLASTIDDLLTSQVAFNLGRFIDSPRGTPAQVSIGAGSVTTTNLASLNLSSPLTNAVTRTNTATTAAGAVIPGITRTLTGVANTFTLTPGGTNQSTQSWSLTTDNESDQERRLRALYRYAVGAISDDGLCKEYALISSNPVMPKQGDKATHPILDGQFLREPSCVICSGTVNEDIPSAIKSDKSRVCPGVSDLYINSRLRQGWLVTNTNDAGETEGLTYIGQSRDYFLYTRDSEDFHQFVLFIAEATQLGTAVGQSGKPSVSARGALSAPAQPTFILPQAQ